jgi:hypothetical protein
MKESVVAIVGVRYVGLLEAFQKLEAGVKVASFRHKY